MAYLTGANKPDNTLILFQRTNQMWQDLKKTLLSEAETSHNISLDELVVAAAEEAKERVPLLIGSLLNDQHANLPKDTRFEADLFTGILLKKMSEINIPAASDYKTNRNALNTAAVVLTSFTCNTIKGLKSKSPSPFVNYIKEQAKYEARLVFKRDSETESCISTKTLTKDEETLHRRTVRLADFQETLNFDDMMAADRRRYLDAEMSVSLKRLIVHEHPEQEALLQGVSKINFEIATEKLKSAATCSPDSSPNRARRGSNDVSTPNSSTHSTASSCSPTSGSKLAAENMRINSLQSQLDRAILQQEDNGTSEELERTITDLKRQLADLKGTDTISDTGIASRNLFGSDLGQKPKCSAENLTHLQQLKASPGTDLALENVILSLGEGLDRTGDTVQEDRSPDSTYSSQNNLI